jgi:hypothetical protein
MKTSKSIIDYRKTKRGISATHNMEKNYYKISKNLNKSLQSTVTASCEYFRFDFNNV